MRTKALIALLCAGLLAACGGTQPAGTETPVPMPPAQAWIDAPLDGAHLPLAEIQLTFSGWDPAGELQAFAFSINGEGQGQLEPQFEASQGDFTYKYGQTAWTPPAPGTYLIEVQGIGPNGPGETASAMITICDPGTTALAAVCEQPAAEQPTATPLPDLALLAVPTQNANCRLGPSATFFDISDTLFEAEQYTPIGQGPDQLWLLFRGPASEVGCWVLASNLDLFCDEAPVELGDLSPCNLATAAYPPMPTLTPTFTPEPTETPTPPECNDGVDNDADGNTDMRDPQCSAPSDNSE